MLPDVVALPSSEMAKMRRRGLLMPYEPPQAAAYPPELKTPFFTVYCLKPYGLAYNKLKVEAKQVPKRYSELAGEAWIGRFIHLDPFRNDGVLLWLARMFDAIGPSLFKKIYSQASSTVKDFDEALSLVTSGEAIAAFPVRLEKPKLQDDHVGFAFIPPVFVETESVGIVANATSPNAAKLFVNFMLSEEGQRTLAGQVRIPARPGTPSPIPLSELDPIFDLEEFNPEEWRLKAEEIYE